MLQSNVAEEEVRRPTLDTTMSGPRKARLQPSADQSSIRSTDATSSLSTNIQSPQPAWDASSDPESEPEVTTQTGSAVRNVAAAHDLGLRMYTIELPNLSSDAAPLEDDKFYGLELYAAQHSDGHPASGTVVTFDSDGAGSHHAIVQVNNVFVLGSSLQEVQQIISTQGRLAEGLQLVLANPNHVEKMAPYLPRAEVDAHLRTWSAPQLSRSARGNRVEDAEYDWRIVGKSESYVHQLQVDTTPLSDEDKRFALNFRPLDVLPAGIDWSKTFRAPAAEDFPPDTDPLHTNPALYQHRHFNGVTHLPNDKETTTAPPLSVDTIPVGNSFNYLPNDLSGDTRLHNDKEHSMVQPLAVDAIPVGNSAGYMPRELEGRTGLCNDAEHSYMNPLSPDGDSRSGGNPMFNHSRDFAHIDALHDWKGTGTQGYATLGADPSAAVTQLTMSRDYDAMGSHQDWQKPGVRPTGTSIALKPEASTGSSALTTARDITPGGFDLSAIQRDEGQVYDSTEMFPSTNPRQFDALSPEFGWKPGGTAPTSKAPGFDTEASTGAIIDLNQREFYQLPEAFDWKPGQNVARNDLVDTEPSQGSISLRNPREFDAMSGVHDWKPGQNVARNDTEDTEPSQGSISLRNPREFDAMSGDHDWKPGQNVARNDLVDTEPSQGSISLRNPRELDAMSGVHDWKPGQNVARNDLVDTEPSQGSISLRNPRELDAMNGHTDWKSSGINPTAELIPTDTEPSQGSISLRNPRELDAMSGFHDWKSSGVNPTGYMIALDSTPADRPSRLSSTFRSFEHRGSEDWRGGVPATNDMYDTDVTGGNACMNNPRDLDRPELEWVWDPTTSEMVPLAAFTEPSTGSALTGHARDFDAISPDRDWKQNNAGRSELVPIELDVTPLAYSENLRKLDRLPADQDWKHVNASNATQQIAPAAAAGDVVQAQTNPQFRPLYTTEDGKRSFVGTNPAGSKPLGNLEREQYVDPSKRMTKFYQRGAPAPNKLHGGSLRAPIKIETTAPNAKRASPSPKAQRAATRMTPRRNIPKPSSLNSTGKVWAGNVSSNMAAFLEGEHRRRARSGKVDAPFGARPATSAGRDPQFSPLSLSPADARRNSLPTDSLEALMTTLSSRAFFEGCKIPCPSPRLLSTPPRTPAPPDSMSSRIPVSWSNQASGGPSSGGPAVSSRSTPLARSPVSVADSAEDATREAKVTILPFNENTDQLDISPKHGGGVDISRVTMLDDVNTAPPANFIQDGRRIVDTSDIPYRKTRFSVNVSQSKVLPKPAPVRGGLRKTFI